MTNCCYCSKVASLPTNTHPKIRAEINVSNPFITNTLLNSIPMNPSTNVVFNNQWPSILGQTKPSPSYTQVNCNNKMKKNKNQTK